MVQIVERLDSRLATIEGLMRDLCQKEKPLSGTHDEYLRASEVIGKFCCRSTFYDHVNAGLFRVYKFGRSSFVKRDEFFAVFTPTETLGHKKGGNV